MRRRSDTLSGEGAPTNPPPGPRHVDPTEQLVVEVFVRDLELAITFYQALGFALIDRHDRFAGLAWEDHRFFLDERPGTQAPASPVANVRIMVPDVDAWWRRARELGASVIDPTADRYYGLRDFTIADPDGFGIRFATRLPRRP